MEYGYDHPEQWFPDLVWAPGGKIPEDLRSSKSHRGLNAHRHHHKDTQLCRACGWTSRHELYAGYNPRLKIFYARNNIGLWAIGGRWVVRDQPNDATLGNDYMTQQFIRSHSQLTVNIPLIREMRLLSEPADQVQFTLMSQLQGQRLDLLWPTLSRDQKSRYARQLGDAIKSLRQFHAPTAQKVNGDRLDDIVVATCNRLHPPTCKKMGATNDEWFDNMAPKLRHGLARIHRTQDRDVIEEKLQQLKDNFPPSEPYVLTHGDLNLSNVMIKDDQIEAIIDWEMAGYHPWWVEYKRMGWHWPVDRADPEDELLAIAWRQVEPDIDYRALFRETWPKIQAVIDVWEACDIDHPDKHSAWLRTDFCECQPFAGRIRSLDIGKPWGHRIRDPIAALMTPRPLRGTVDELTQSQLGALE